MDSRVLLIKALFIFYCFCFIILFFLYCEQKQYLKDISELVDSQINDLLKQRAFLPKKALP